MYAPQVVNPSLPPERLSNISQGPNWSAAETTRAKAVWGS